MNHQPFQVELSGIIKILSDHLYTSNKVFIRELIQNASDAITARQKLEAFEPEIRIEYFKNDEGDGYVVSDNGIGLTEPQISEFLARIGASSKALTEKKALRSDFIGQFGIGLLSCFMVTDEIVVLTRSASDNQGFRWTGYINGTYQVEKLDEALPVGTKVVLKLRKDSGFNEDRIRTQLAGYARYLSLPIQLEINGGESEKINSDFPWELPQGQELLMGIGQEIFDQPFSHAFLLKPTEESPAEGAIFILPSTDHLASQTKGRLYVKRMFVTEKCEEILPEWAFFVKVMVNSNDLGLNASRESIYPDVKSKRLKNHIAQAIKNHLMSLAKNAPTTLRQIIAAHSTALKRMALADDEFLRFIYPYFVFYTSMGPLSLEEIKAKSGQVFFVPDIDEFRQVVPVAMSNGKLVVNAGYIHDAAVIRQIALVDNATNYIEADAAYFGNFLGEVDLPTYDGYRMRLTQLQAHLDKFNCRLSLKQFEPENVPAIYHANQDTQLARDIDEISSVANDDWAAVTEGIFGDVESEASTIYLNFNNRVVKKLMDQSSAYDKAVTETLLTNAMLMGHYPLNFLELETMNENLNLLAAMALNPPAK